MNTTVPVDIIPGTKLSRALNDLTQQLFIAVPSFNSPPQTVGPTAYVNPATLRGLGPDQTLVLLNGQRRHASANIFSIYSIGYGSGATDLNCFPAAAIEEVQILKDGATAQYGSDGIAGVIDIRLKESTGKTEANLHLGQFYKGDGETVAFDINSGFQINRKGFINFTGAARFSKPTQRNGEYQGRVYYNYSQNATRLDSIQIESMDDSAIDANNFDRLNHRRIGNPQLLNSSIIINGAYPLTKNTNLFWTGTFNYRYTEDGGSNAYRYPKDTASIISDLYPDGFQMVYFGTNLNASLIAGIEGRTKKGWKWDISSVYGGNSNELFLTNTNNATQYSLGKNAQTSFHPGSIFYSQNTNNINWSRNFANQLNRIKSFSLSFGGEFRMDNFQIKKGEEASYKNYAPGSGKQWGSQGVAGNSDSNAIHRNRYVSAAYIELEIEKNEKFLLNVASRYEDYSDYGGNLAGKLALRYKFSNRLLLRGSFSNGFRAPALQQRYISNASPTSVRGVIFIAETFRNEGRTADAFGIAPLRAEESLNASGGITSRITKNINITLDAYWIQVRNRVTLTGLISRDSSVWIKDILNSLGKYDIRSIRFFANAISTRTKGIDLVVTGNWLFRKSILEISLSGNYNKTHIYEIVQPAKNLPDDSKHLNLVVNREERGRLEEAQPLSKIILGIEYKKGKWDFNFRTVYFGKAARLAVNVDKTTGLYPDEFFTPKTLVGCSIGYSPIKWMTIKVGARNVFNTYPDKIKNKSNTQSGLVTYDFNSTQIGYNGGYYFMNMNFNF